MDNFWTILVETWQTGIRGFGISEIIISLLIIVLSLIIRSLINTKVIDWIGKQANKTDSTLDDDIIESLRYPIGLIPIAFGFYLVAFYLPLEGTLDFVATNLVKMFVIFTIFSALASVTGPLLSLIEEKWMTAAMVDWLRKTIQVLILSLIHI